MKISRRQLKKLIGESMLPGKLGDGGMGPGRFPGDERPSPRQPMYGDSHPSVDDVLG